MKLSLVVVFLLLALCASFVRAEPFLIWNKTYGVDAGHAYDVVPSGDGGFLIYGRAPTSVTSLNLYLLKVDSEGNRVWEQTYSTKMSDGRVIGEPCQFTSQALVQSGEGGFVLIGKSSCAISSAMIGIHYCSIYLLKVDANGDKVWEKIYKAQYGVHAHSIIRCEDGGFIVTGNIDDYYRDGFYVLKVDSEGEKVWDNVYFPRSWAYDITESGDGGYVLTGYSYNEKDIREHIYILKIDFEGNRVWEKTYGGSDDTVGRAITRSDEGFIVAGYKTNVVGNDKDGRPYKGDAPYVLGLDQYGNKTWEKTYTPGPSFGANDIIPMGDGFLVVGNRFLKIDNRGNRIWETTIPYCQEATSITEAGDGGFVFVCRQKFYVAKIRDTQPYPMPELPFGIMWCLLLLLAVECSDMVDEDNLLLRFSRFLLKNVVVTLGIVLCG